MLIYSIIAVAVILFTVGAYFVIKGFRVANKDDSEIVPISDIDELSEMKKKFFPGAKEFSNLNKDDVPLTEHLMNENFKKDDLIPGKEPDPNIAIIEKYKVDIETYKASINSLSIKIDYLNNKNKKLEDAIERELSSKDTTTLSNEEKEMLRENQKKSEKAQESIDNLTKESIATNSLIAKQKEKINQLESSVDKYKDLSEIADDLKNKNDEANALITDYAEKISSLEGQITFTKGSLDEYKSSIQTRIKQLEDEKIKFDEKQKHLMDELSNMEMVKDENNVLKEALNSLESDLVVVKQEYLQKSKESDLKIEMFDKGKEELLRNILETELNLNKLKEYNAYLLTKEKVLQYELTKNRAKALGFEKICEDFKRRIDNEERPAEIEGIFN